MFNSIFFTELFRYVVNGLIATAANYSAMAFFIDFLSKGNAWLASILACAVGITVSFLGSRYFVFNSSSKGEVIPQIGRFICVYASAAALYGLVLYFWTDCLGYPWQIGFLLATGLQVCISYLANKFFVFK